MLSVKVNLGNIGETVSKATEYGQFVLDEVILKDSNYYIPEHQGYLRDSGVIHSKIGEGELRWSEPYARRLYYNPQYDFSTDRNPQARGMWYEYSKSQNRKDWLKQAENAVKSRL
ncbi:hypothetical protein J2Z83_003733 [Virgibacillus natechei]|uniref:Minor capsid protein n=1 Tax=Virgibacillus natechei TaxID=1216297 RepID=A0ABS4IKU6_9BACI|nr:minor capsid protein [Virgibacillus natechei]MBP1971582.1 hypothetical protein [Virgibacillus natechei]UZD13085.1 minor capsid protein [Virgibacillus natechei]